MSVCQYIFDMDKGMLFDTAIAISRAVREQKGFSYTNFLDDFDLKLDEKLLSTTEQICQEIDVSSSACQLIFNFPEFNSSCFRVIFENVLTSSDNINELICGIRNVDPDEVAIRLLSLYDIENTFSTSFYRTLIATKIMLPDFLDGLSLSSDIKWKLRNFIDDPRNSMEQLLAVIKKTYDRVKKEFKTHRSLIDDYFGGLQKQFEETGDKFIYNTVDHYRNYVEQHNIQTVCFSFSLFQPYDVIFHFQPNNYFAHIGYDFETTVSFANVARDNKALIYKTFKDQTKLHILECLSKEDKMSLKTLSEKINIPVALLNAPIMTLLHMQMIVHFDEKKQSYFSIHRHALFLAIQMLQQSTSEGEESIEKKSKTQKELAGPEARNADGGGA